MFFEAKDHALFCRDQEGRRGSEEAVPGPSVFPSGEPGVSGDFWARVAAAFSSCDGDLSLPLGLALGSPNRPFVEL